MEAIQIINYGKFNFLLLMGDFIFIYSDCFGKRRFELNHSILLYDYLLEKKSLNLHYLNFFNSRYLNFNFFRLSLYRFSKDFLQFNFHQILCLNILIKF